MKHSPVLVAAAAAATLVVTMVTGAPADAAPSVSIPTITPTPQSVQALGSPVHLPGRVEVVTDDTTDPAALADLREVLGENGVDRVDVISAPGNAPMRIVLVGADSPLAASALGGAPAPSAAESYVLATAQRGAPQGSVGMVGADLAGQFYAVQTFDQALVTVDDSVWVPGMRVVDAPSMPLRGSIEGFYGQPWSHQERMDQFPFYGDLKLNTYIYAPKDDAYHRDRWRDPYPAEDLDRLAELVTEATANHVRFTFALSPGGSICFSSEADYAALIGKFQQMYDIGVRAFNVPFDDINYTQWHCDSDRTTYGNPSAGAAGQAQAALLDRIQTEFIDTHEGAYPLQMVPTEYSDLSDTAYKAALRGMDPNIVVMWTGTDVVPPHITLEDSARAAQVYGGPVFVWDNYPVNDFGNTSGRLLLAPYDKRDLGLSANVAGIVANPMNQAAASKIALFGVAGFTWNDTAYDAEATWQQALLYLSDGDAETAAALGVWADLSRMAPTFGSQPWQEQAPALRGQIADFWALWDQDKTAAVEQLRPYVDAIAAAPEQIEAGVTDPLFLSDAQPWLTAGALWGQASQAMLDALAARIAGDVEGSDALLAHSKDLQAQAAAVRVEPADNSWGNAPVRMGDGVLNSFLGELELRLSLFDLGDVTDVATSGTATASSVELDLPQFQPAMINDGDLGTRWASGYDDASWVQIALPEPVSLRGVGLHWEGACANAYDIQTSADGVTWTTAVHVDDTSCGFDLRQVNVDNVSFVRMQGIERKTQWGYSIYEMNLYALN